MALGPGPASLETPLHHGAAAPVRDDHEIGHRRHWDVETTIAVGPQLNALPALTGTAAQQLTGYPARQFFRSNEECHGIFPTSRTDGTCANYCRRQVWTCQAEPEWAWRTLAVFSAFGEPTSWTPRRRNLLASSRRNDCRWT